MSQQVETVRTTGATVAVARFHVRTDEMPEIGQRLGRALGTVASALEGLHVAPTGPAIACYESRADGVDVAAGFQVAATFPGAPEVERLDLPAVDAVHTTHVGSYRGLPAAYRRLQDAARAESRSLATDAPMWEEYWSEPGTPDSQTRTEVYWPLRPE